MMTEARKKRESDNEDGESDLAKEDEGKKVAVLKMEGAPLHYNLEVGIMMNSITSCRAHQINVCEEAVYGWG